MNELVELWIQALRSGKYEQGKGALRVGDRFCCLGVLCEVAEIKSELKGNYCYYGGEWCTVPEDLERVLEENHLDPNSLINFNDTDCWSFEQIADYIERKTHESSQVNNLG